MLSRALKDHQAKQAAAKVNIDHLRREATNAAAGLSNALADTLNADVSLAFQNQKDVESEAKKLQAAAARYGRQTRQWLALVDDLNGALKELGDLESWSGAIEHDFRDVCLTIERAHGVLPSDS